MIATTTQRRHPLVARLAQAQLDAQSVEEKAAAAKIDAHELFIQRRVLAASHARGRALLAWASEHGHAHALCFTELSAAIAHGEPIAMLLMACWADFPEAKEIA